MKALSADDGARLEAVAAEQERRRVLAGQVRAAGPALLHVDVKTPGLDSRAKDCLYVVNDRGGCTMILVGPSWDGIDYDTLIAQDHALEEAPLGFLEVLAREALSPVTDPAERKVLLAKLSGETRHHVEAVLATASRPRP